MLKVKKEQLLTALIAGLTIRLIVHSDPVLGFVFLFACALVCFIVYIDKTKNIAVEEYKAELKKVKDKQEALEIMLSLKNVRV